MNTDYSTCSLSQQLTTVLVTHGQAHRPEIAQLALSAALVEASSPGYRADEALSLFAHYDDGAVLALMAVPLALNARNTDLVFHYERVKLEVPRTALAAIIRDCWAIAHTHDLSAMSPAQLVDFCLSLVQAA